MVARGMFGLVVALFVGAAAFPLTVRAQETRADSAAVLVQAALRLADEGERDVAATLLRYIIRWYGDTPAARDAARRLAAADRAGAAGSGRTGFVITNTLIGGWLGAAVPAAFGADDPTPYGIGLIAGPGLGLAGSLLYTNSYPITTGQTAAYRWSFVWLSWQGFLFRELTGIGDEQGACDQFGCSPDYTPGEARWASLVLGGAAGIGTGLVLTRLNLPPGDVAVVQDASMWGTGYGAALALLVASDADPSDEGLYGAMAGVGNAFLLGGIPLARAWRPSVGRIRLITLSGVAGALVGLGIDLIAEFEDEKIAVLVPTLGSAVGLGTGIVLTRRRDVPPLPALGPADGRALFHLGREAGLGTPVPEPRALPALKPDGTLGRQPALGFRLLEVRF